MVQARLKLNHDKTEFLVITSPYYLDKLDKTLLNVGGTALSPSKVCRNLGVLFDHYLNMKLHVSSVCRSSYFHLRRIGSIRKYLNDESCAQLIHAFVSSRLDYCNALISNLPNNLYAKLQKVQNTAARILSRTRKFDSISPILIQLHWLPIPLRVNYKLALLVFKCLRGLGPSYLQDILHTYVPSRSLQSSSRNLLIVPKYKLSTYGNRSFAVAAPKLWNSLPENLKCINDLGTFKCYLKTYLFKLFVENPSLFIHS